MTEEKAFADIAGVIREYFDGLYHCDVRKLANVMHEKAIYATADEPALLYRTMEEYFPVVAARVSPASRNELRKDRIDSIEVAGENTAFAKVRCSIGSRDFVDFLTFVRVGGRWWIMAKIFQIKNSED